MAALNTQRLVLSVLLLYLLIPSVLPLKLFKSRTEIMALIGERERRLYFSSCEQSSRRAACVFAIDDSYSQELTQCSVTDPESKPWWMAILDTPSYITTVTLLNIDQTYRSHEDALRSVTIMANDDVCFRYQGNDLFVKRSFPCDTVADQISVKSTLEMAVLGLCDVEVYGAPIKFPSVLDAPTPLNVASCVLSSVEGDGYCEHAFDGEMSGDHNVKPCAATSSSSEFNQFLDAFLLQPALITEVRIFNRFDYGVTDFTILVNNRQCVDHKERFTSMGFPCKYFGDVVRVANNKQGSLSICEVQIIGYSAALGEPEKYKPLGCYKDDFKDRDLTQLVSSTLMRHEKCFKMCKRLGQKYFGVQDGRHCWCGSAFGKHGKLDDKACSVPCEDVSQEICGGQMANNVFEII